MLKDGLAFVMAVNLIIWCGIAVYLFFLDKRIRGLERAARERESGLT